MAVLAPPISKPKAAMPSQTRGVAHGPAQRMREAPLRVQSLGAMAERLNARPAVVAQRALAQRLNAGIPVNDDQSLEREADVMGARATAEAPSLKADLLDLDIPKGPGTAAPLQGEFTSIPEARRAAGDTNGNENVRVEAEAYLNQADAMAANGIRASVANGALDTALAKATVLAGLPGAQYKVKSTANYADVVGNAEIPRVTPSGVTVMEQGSPVIYIHEDNILKWVNGGDIGNLLATIRHEATHADQARRPNGPMGDDEREFEAYAAEITHVQELFAAGEDSLVPSSAHLATSYRKAGEHYAALPAPVPQPLQAIKDRIDPQYMGVEELGRRRPGLKRFLEENDLASGRVDRIEAATRTALRTYIDDYIDDATTPYPSLAYNDYRGIPEQFRTPLDAEFNPLFDQAADFHRKRR